MKLDPYHTPYTKTNSKWVKDLNVRPKTYMLLTGHKLHDIGFSNDFLNISPRAQVTATKKTIGLEHF